MKIMKATQRLVFNLNVQTVCKNFSLTSTTDNIYFLQYGV